MHICLGQISFGYMSSNHIENNLPMFCKNEGINNEHFE
jgi:hypothetical protein